MPEMNGSPLTADAETEFAELLRDLWRAVTRAVRSKEHLPTLPKNQADALREIVTSDGMTPTQLSTALGLSRPTISELVQKLEDDQFIVRRASRIDRRSTVLMPTDRARHVHLAFRTSRVTVVSEAMRGLSPRDSRRLLANVPALSQLLSELEKIADRADMEAKRRMA